MVWRRLGDKPSSEPMMVSLLTHRRHSALGKSINNWKRMEVRSVIGHRFACWCLGAKAPCNQHLQHWPRVYCTTMYIIFINSLWPNDAIWRHRSMSTLTQVMACCQAITWTSVDSSSVRSSDIQLRATQPKIVHPSITKISLKITCLKFYLNLPGANELTHRLVEDE